VKPSLVLFFTLENIRTMLFCLCAGANLVLRGREGGVEQFDLAAQSLMKALVYALMTWKVLEVIIIQLLFIASRIMMSIPGIVTSIPETIRACTQDGCLTVARRESHRFATGFCGMFSRTRPQEAAAVHPIATAHTAEQTSTFNEAVDKEAMLAARRRRFGGATS